MTNLNLLCVRLKCGYFLSFGNLWPLFSSEEIKGKVFKRRNSLIVFNSVWGILTCYVDTPTPHMLHPGDFGDDYIPTFHQLRFDVHIPIAILNRTLLIFLYT